VLNEGRKLLIESMDNSKILLQIRKTFPESLLLLLLLLLLLPFLLDLDLLDLEGCGLLDFYYNILHLLSEAS